MMTIGRFSDFLANNNKASIIRLIGVFSSNIADTLLASASARRLYGRVQGRTWLPGHSVNKVSLTSEIIKSFPRVPGRRGVSKPEVQGNSRSSGHPHRGREPHVHLRCWKVPSIPTGASAINGAALEQK